MKVKVVQSCPTLCNPGVGSLSLHQQIFPTQELNWGLLHCRQILYQLSYPRQHIEKQRHHFAIKGPYSQSCGFSSILVWMWELDHKEDWAPKNWCFQTLVLEKILESPLDCKEIKPVNTKWSQPWISIEGLMLKLQYSGHLMQRAESLELSWYWERLKGKGKEGSRG